MLLKSVAIHSTYNRTAVSIQIFFTEIFCVAFFSFLHACQVFNYNVDLIISDRFRLTYFAGISKIEISNNLKLEKITMTCTVRQKLSNDVL